MCFSAVWYNILLSVLGYRLKGCTPTQALYPALSVSDILSSATTYCIGIHNGYDSYDVAILC